jgi:thiol:disulfide interchange protein
LASSTRFPLVLVLAFAAVLASAALPASAQTADDLLAQAEVAARAQHKNILLVFSASWCGPCKLYERFLEDPQMMPITEKAFVLQRIDVGERMGDPKHTDTPGGVALRSSLGAQGEPGFPFLVITDANGAPIVNSYIHGDASNNIGYPAVPNEIDWYIDMLRRATPALSQADLIATRNWLQAHSPHR